MRKILPFMILISNYQNAMMQAPNYQAYVTAPYPQQGNYLSPEGRIAHNNADEHHYNRQTQQYYSVYNRGIKEGTQHIIVLGSVCMLSTFSFILGICGIIATVASNQNYDALLIAFHGKEHLILGTHTSLGQTITVASSCCLCFSIFVVAAFIRILSIHI